MINGVVAELDRAVSLVRGELFVLCKKVDRALHEEQSPTRIGALEAYREALRKISIPNVPAGAWERGLIEEEAHEPQLIEGDVITLPPGIPGCPPGEYTLGSPWPPIECCRVKKPCPLE